MTDRESLMEAREAELVELLRRVIAHPRWLSIGSIANVAELRVSRELLEEAMVAVRGK